MWQCIQHCGLSHLTLYVKRLLPHLTDTQPSRRSSENRRLEECSGNRLHSLAQDMVITDVEDVFGPRIVKYSRKMASNKPIIQ